MKYSIIVPIYKIEAYLKECIDSVLHQDFHDWELILVDDGSPDKCPEICDEYANIDNRIKVVHKPNGGLVSARIAGAKVASGDYIVCVDGDDSIQDDYLSSLSNVVEIYSPDVIITGCTYVKSQARTKHFSSIKCGFYEREEIEKDICPSLIKDQNAKGIEVTVWAKAYKRALYTKHQLEVSPSIIMGEDRACVIPIIYDSKSICVIDSTGYNYRAVDTSMTHVKRPQNLWGPKLIHEHLINHIDINAFDFKNQIYRSTGTGVFSVAVSQFYTTDSYFAVRERILKLLHDSVYHDAIRNARFSCSLRGRLISISLKYKLICLMWLLSKLK